MLVLSRKAGQRIHIGDDIVIEVRRVAGNRVTVALEAPRDVRILRGELQLAATEFDIEESEELPASPKRKGSSPRFQPTATAQLTHLTSHLTASEMVG